MRRRSEGWLPSNTALHGGKAVPAKPTLKMDRGELGAEAGREWTRVVKALPKRCEVSRGNKC